MAYDSASAEALYGEWGEDEIIARSTRNRWYAARLSEIGTGAAMATGPDGKKLVIADVLLLDPIKGRKARLVEVKAKRGAYMFHKRKIICTGFDWPQWEALLDMSRSGVLVDVALIHAHWPLRDSPEIEPKLLWQTVKTLAECEVMPFSHPSFPRGAAVWDVNDFQLLGDLPKPPPHIIEALRATKCNLRIWETGKPPKPLRRPREMPEQYELFPEPDAAVDSGWQSLDDLAKRVRERLRR